MDVILTGNVSNLGRTGDKVKVADGYARNFLFPRGLAIRSTAKNAKQLEHQKRIIQRKLERELLETRSQAEKLDGLELTFERNVGDDEKLFGSVTVRDIEQALHEHGFDIDRRLIKIDGPLKKLGTVPVTLKFHATISATIKVCIVATQ
ncbi:MAG: 50S ribosomal protein L9 [Myxococcales bacterium]|nr:50S ribosomal protein L9 [Myxococcales bacterium]